MRGTPEMKLRRPQRSPRGSVGLLDFARLLFADEQLQRASDPDAGEIRFAVRHVRDLGGSRLSERRAGAQRDGHDRTNVITARPSQRADPLSFCGRLRM